MSSEEEFPEPTGPPIVLVIDDPVVRTRVERTAREMSAILIPSRDVATCRHLPGHPRLIIVDVSLSGALDAIGGWKTDHPGVPVIGVLRLPDPDLWTQAESAGADLVVTHGTVHRRMAAFLEGFSTRPAGRRVRVAPLKDFQGRLGHVGLLENEAGAEGEIALYHVGREIYAASNSCPHAGARLSEGGLSDAVVTCPRHGSQFDVTTGERLRGPADDPIKTYPVIVEGGIVYVEIADAPA